MIVILTGYIDIQAGEINTGYAEFITELLK